MHYFTLVFLLVILSTGSASEYKVSLIGTESISGNWKASDINDRGQVIGSSSNASFISDQRPQEQ